METSMTKHTFLVQGTQRAPKIGSLNQPQIRKNRSLDLKVSFLVLEDVEAEAPSLLNDKFGHRNLRPVCKYAKNLQS